MFSNKGITYEGEVVDVQKDQLVNKMDNSVDVLIHTVEENKTETPQDPESDGKAVVNDESQEKNEDKKNDDKEDKKEDKKENEKEDEKEEKKGWGGWTKSMENLFLWWN